MFEDQIYNFRKELQNLGYCTSVVKNYPKYAQNLLVFTNENYTKINPNHIKKYYEYLQTKPHKNQQKTISQSYIHCQLLGVKLYFEYLERINKIKVNPYNLRIKTTKSNPRKSLNQQQIETLYQACKNSNERTILNLCYGCGLRRNEVEKLNIKDINFDKKLLFVRSGKGKKRRVIPLTKAIVKDLKAYCEDSFFYRSSNQEAFLINNLSNRITGSSIYKIFKIILKRTKISNQNDYCLHSLRHSIASHLLENEMSMEMVRDFLGHNQLGTTQIYTRINKLKIK
jgi:integrase/recombinase XerD